MNRSGNRAALPPLFPPPAQSVWRHFGLPSSGELISGPLRDRLLARARRRRRCGSRRSVPSRAGGGRGERAPRTAVSHATRRGTPWDVVGSPAVHAPPRPTEPAAPPHGDLTAARDVTARALPGLPATRHTGGQQHSTSTSTSTSTSAARPPESHGAPRPTGAASLQFMANNNANAIRFTIHIQLGAVHMEIYSAPRWRKS